MSENEEVSSSGKASSPDEDENLQVPENPEEVE